MNSIAIYNIHIPKYNTNLKQTVQLTGSCYCKNTDELGYIPSVCVAQMWDCVGQVESHVPHMLHLFFY